MKNLYSKFAGILAALALFITAGTVGVTCVFYVHQPKLPEGAMKLRKF
jgi:cyclic lactone autoinducer peptide